MNSILVPKEILADFEIPNIEELPSIQASDTTTNAICATTGDKKFKLHKYEYLYLLIKTNS